MYLFPFSWSLLDTEMTSANHPQVPPPDWLVLPDELSSSDNDCISCNKYEMAWKGRVTCDCIPPDCTVYHIGIFECSLFSSILSLICHRCVKLMVSSQPYAIDLNQDRCHFECNTENKAVWDRFGVFKKATHYKGPVIVLNSSTFIKFVCTEIFFGFSRERRFIS